MHSSSPSSPNHSSSKDRLQAESSRPTPHTPSRRRAPVPLREWLVATSAGLTLAFTAWGLGGVVPWSLHTLLAGGVLTLLLSLGPLPRGPHSPLQSLQRLATWPPFWASLLFLLYLLIGALNPSAEVMRDARGWWVESINPPWGTFLPHSVRADYATMNAWRVIASFAGAFTLIWGLWAGITRRKPILLVLWCLLLSGAGMGLVAILQHLSEAKAVLWTVPSSNPNFWGSFFYRNQGAAYLNLILVTSGVLFFYHAAKTRAYGRSGGPHFLCFLLFALVATSVGLALSRGGILFAGVLTLGFLGLAGIHALRGLGQLRSVWAALIPLALLIAGVFALVRYVDLDAIEQRFGDVEATIENAERDARALSTKATWDMAQDQLVFGWGAGSFRYIFPIYQQNYPQLFYQYYHKKKQQWIGRKMYRYAHNDLVQFLAEYGLIGCGLLLLMLAGILAPLLWQIGQAPLLVLYLLLGVATSGSHAFLDFILNSPAYWCAFLGLLTASAKLMQLERLRAAGRRPEGGQSPQ